MAKVFIIDNNIEFIQKLSTRLEAEKFFDVSRTADNGKDGLNLISKYRGSIDILIIDLMLPIYDGLKVITEINKTNCQLTQKPEADFFLRLTDWHFLNCKT